MTDDQTITRFEGTTLVVESGGKTEEFDAEFLVAVLLVSISSSDGEIAPIELEKMLQLAARHFELGSSESIKFLSSAVESLAADPELTDILEALASNLTDPQKEDVAVMMYEVVAADGREDASELDALAAAAENIGISQDLLKTARQRFDAER